MKTNQTPAKAKLQMTALGTFLRGFLASPPKAVALSKPTRLKMDMTIPRLRP
jgi:hypothetical protein